ncbi:MAG: hypothetical protein QW769_06430 [Nitrososphaerales archaeon]
MSKWILTNIKSKGVRTNNTNYGIGVVRTCLMLRILTAISNQGIFSEIFPDKFMLNKSIHIAFALVISIIIAGLMMQSLYAQETDFGSVLGLDGGTDSNLPRIAVFSDILYVTWESDGDILFTASTNQGSSFGKVMNLSNNPKHSFKPQIAASGKNVYVTWESDGDILFTASTNQGSSFGKVMNLSNNPGHASLPQIAVSGKNVYVTWEDLTFSRRDILFTASTNEGINFGKVMNLSSNSADSFNPKVAAFGKNVYVTWEDFTPGRPDILFTASTNQGSSFGKVMNLSNNPKHSFKPQIAASGDNLYVMWQDFTPGKPTMFLTLSTNQGSSFSKLINLNNRSVSVEKTPNVKADEQPRNFIEVTSGKGGKVVQTYTDTIVIKNKSNMTLNSVRLSLSPSIASSFTLEQYSIKSIGPQSNATVAIKLQGKPNEDVNRGITSYRGYVAVSPANYDPVQLQVRIGASASSSYQEYIANVTQMAKQRYDRSISTLSSSATNERPDYEVGLPNGAKTISSASGKITIKNVSDKTLHNVRITTVLPSNIFLLDKKTIDSLPPGSTAVVQMKSLIDVAPHTGFSGELVISPVNSRATAIPINISPSETTEKFEVRLASGSDKISTLSESITIKNTTNRPMDGVRLILVPSNIRMSFDLSENSIRSIAPGEQVKIDLKLRAGSNVMQLTNNYAGELIIAAANHGQTKVFPINITWKDTSSQHFIIYSRDNSQDISKAREISRFLETKYASVAKKFGELNSKTVIYMLGSTDEINMITKSAIPYYYSYKNDLGFINSKSDKLKETALQSLVYRNLMVNQVHGNRQKFLQDNGNWLLDGIAHYTVATMLGNYKPQPSQWESLVSNPSLDWYGASFQRDYMASYAFFAFLEDKYGSKVIDRIVDYLDSVMIGNHNCNTLEQCSVMRAVYDMIGLDMNNIKNKYSFDDLKKEWFDFLKPMTVRIDVKQDTNTNSEQKNIRIRVAILGSDDFNPDKIDVTTLRFGPVNALATKAPTMEDVNGDGIKDLISYYKLPKAKVGNKSETCLNGTLLNGRPIAGCEIIKIN